MKPFRFTGILDVWGEQIHVQDRWGHWRPLTELIKNYSRKRVRITVEVIEDEARP